MRATNVRVTFLGLALLVTCSVGCAPSSPRADNGQDPSASASNGPLELTDEMIHERVTGARVRDVPEENGAAPPISWSFFRSEPKEITIVDKKVEATRATIVLDIKTQSSPRSREQRSLAGQIRTEWALRSGWVLRQWEIVGTENISMKYKNLPMPADQNSNR